MRHWVVGSALIESDAGLLLVANRRRDGAVDWTPPGGVIDDGEDLLEGLTREVEEETGLRVTAWGPCAYRVEAEHPELQWTLQVEVHRALAVEGQLRVDDPDGIVVDARWVPVDECDAVLAETWMLVHEPIGAWLSERWEGQRTYRYRVEGRERAGMNVVRLPSARA